MTEQKKDMSEEEKHQLALKLDQDLEEFINSRKNTPYSEGWKEETWEQVHFWIPSFANSADSILSTRKWNSTHFSWKNYRKKENPCHLSLKLFNN